MTKKEKFIQAIKQQLNVELENDKDCIFNQKRNVLYTRVTQREVLNYCIKHDMGYCGI